MSSCESFQSHLIEYVADGEPQTPEHEALRRHLAGCADCRAQMVRLRMVEDGLRTYPLVVAPAELAGRILACLAPDADRQEEWRWLPLDLWVPALVLVIALALATLALPEPVLYDPLANLGADWSAGLQDLTMGLRHRMDTASFWALWLGVFVSAAGLGVAIGLTGWRRAGARSHQALHDRAEHMAEWLESLVGRAP